MRGCRIGSSECRRAGRRGRSGARFRRRHLIPMILHLRDFQMRRPRTLRCDHVENIADRLRVASGFAEILPRLPRTFLTFLISAGTSLIRSNTSAGNLRWSRCNVSQIGGFGISAAPVDSPTVALQTIALQIPVPRQVAPSSPSNRHAVHLAIACATRPRRSHARPRESAQHPCAEYRLPRRR